MGYIFTATVDMQSGGATTSANVFVCQKVLNRSPIPIASIHDSLVCGDLRETTITFADDTLVFNDNYDIPLRAFYSVPFQNREKSKVLSLHVHSPMASRRQYFLSDHSGCYPIHMEFGEDGTFHTITVYNAVPTANRTGLLYPILAELKRTQNTDTGFEYEIQTEEFPSLPFLMAVFSLPFTASSVRM